MSSPNNKLNKLFVLALCFAFLFSGLGNLGTASLARASSPAFFEAVMDPALQNEIDLLGLAAPLEVVIVFSDMGRSPDVAALATTYFEMSSLPMAGAILTGAQIMDIASWPEVYSITLNQDLEYFLHESVAYIGADQVWTNYGQTGGNAVVAIVDSGIDATHPDLLYGAQVIQNVKVLPMQASQENVPLTDTSSGHGTHVAGTIAGNGYMSGGYYRGVAPDAKLVGLGAGEGISILVATQAYDWVLTHHAEYGIRVVSNSWGSTGGSINLRNPVVYATFEAYKQGMLSVFAAGNDGSYDVMNPYSLAPWVVSVAAGDKSGALADFSSRGLDGDYFKHPDITAPGVDIYSTRSKTIGITALDPLPNPIDPTWTPSYTVMSGTSMATPHVSGAAALLFSSNPQLSPDQVIDLLIANTDPMPGYLLHEAGYGYMNVLAAFEDSLDETGNLSAFLAGEQVNTWEDVLGFDPNQPSEYDEYIYEGFVPAGATEASAPIDHTFTVTEETLYVDIQLIWDPQAEDAFDIEVLDPQGRVVISSGNGLEEGEGALFVPTETGTYTLRMYPFAAVAVNYTATIKISYGTGPSNWPPNTAPTYDYYATLSGVYKTYGVLGIVSNYFRSGDQGFINFSLHTGDGLAVEGAASELQVFYTDRNGNTAFIDDAVFDDGDGNYQTSFFVDDTWTGVAGAITVNFAFTGGGTLRALPGSFNLNHLETTLQTSATHYEPGDNISFNGTVQQVNSVAAGSVDYTPLGGATVTLRLVDSEGMELGSVQTTTNLMGNYTGSIAAPAGAAGRVALVAEASYTDPTILLGPGDWYGTAQAGLTFPGNTAPTVSLSATEQTGTGQKNIVHIEAVASDADGASDIADISLVLVDDKGRVVQSWTFNQFSAKADGLSFELVTAMKVQGK
ncbi:MAG TPA: S8 family serine peptidase, partial [Anaerolineales bacterium]|nr:S8 family serine peptidase [Anaerolineales bacterium]